MQQLLPHQHPTKDRGTEAERNDTVSADGQTNPDQMKRPRAKQEYTNSKGFSVRGNSCGKARAFDYL